jgi:hypothetical protein
MMLTEELKAKMRAGRERAAAERKARGEKVQPRKRHLKPGHVSADPPVLATSKTDVSSEFFGLTKDDCPAGCTPERCAIAGTLVFKNKDGTVTREGHCGHPNKCGLQAIHKSNPEIVERYNRAKKFLAHLDIERNEDVRRR